MLPSVRKLMKTFGVSSGTIQSVLKQLSEEGLIYSIRGKGFFWGKAPNIDDLAQLLSKTVHRETILERLEREFATDWEKGFLKTAQPSTTPSIATSSRWMKGLTTTNWLRPTRT